MRYASNYRLPGCASVALVIAFAVTITLGGARQASADPPARDHSNREISTGGISNGEIWRGIVKAVQQPSISTDLLTPISLVGVREGERFKTGRVLLAFDCRRQQHELTALAATVREMRVVADTNQHLVARGASNKNDVEVARARFDKAMAEWAAMSQRLTGCQVLAPFDGIVVEVLSAAFEVPPPNKPLMTIASIDQLEIEIIVPSRRLAQLKPGTELTFTIDETSRTLAATVLRSGGAVDTVSQTAKVYAMFRERNFDVLPGMSGTAVVGSGGR